MSMRSQIIDSLMSHLSSLGKVHRGYMTLDQINDFPTIILHIKDDSIIHISSDIRYSSIDLTLRGYVRGEDSVELVDTILINLEDKLMSFLDIARSLSVEECRVVSSSGDEGVMTPNGVAEMNVLIIYQHR
jgi:hypothetical protein